MLVHSIRREIDYAYSWKCVLNLIRWCFTGKILYKNIVLAGCFTLFHPFLISSLFSKTISVLRSINGFTFQTTWDKKKGSRTHLPWKVRMFLSKEYCSILSGVEAIQPTITNHLSKNWSSLLHVITVTINLEYGIK